jgi:integrase
VCLAFWGALRLSELHQLSPENINFETGDYTLKYTKGDKPRQGVLPLWLCARLWTWIKYNRPEVDGRTAAFNQGVAEARARLEVEASKKLKTGTASQRERYVHRELMLYIKHELASPLFGVKYQAIQKAIMRLPAHVRANVAPDSEEMKLLRDVVMSPHTLRHSFARHWLQNGGDIGRLSQLMGHGSVAITIDNYGRFNMKGVREEYQKITGGS